MAGFSLLALGVVGLARAAPSYEITTEEQANLASQICNSAWATVDQPAGTATCEDLVELGYCLELAGMGEGSGIQGPNMANFKIAAFFNYKRAKKGAYKHCGEHADTAYDNVNAKLEIFSFQHEIVGIFDVEEKTVALEQTLAMKATIDARLAAVKQSLADTYNTQTDQLGRTVLNLEDSISEFEAEEVAKIDDFSKSSNEKVALLSADVVTKEAELTASVTEQLAALSNSVTEQLESYQVLQKWANDTGDLKWDRNYELVAVERSPDTTMNGHAKRLFYKINFNPNNPGHWWSSSGDELKWGCTALSDDLEAIDGIDRALKPACDRGDQHGGHNCDGDGVDLGDTHLSHCGCSSYPRDKDCAGLSNNFLRGAAMYNDHWNGCQYLRHDGQDGQCQHHWVHCHANSAQIAYYTLCTSSNSNNKV